MVNVRSWRRVQARTHTSHLARVLGGSDELVLFGANLVVVDFGSHLTIRILIVREIRKSLVLSSFQVAHTSFHECVSQFCTEGIAICKSTATVAAP